MATEQAAALSPDEDDRPRQEDPASRFVRRLVRNTRAVALVTIGLSVVAGWLALRLTLHAHRAELLPEDDPALVRLHQIGARVGAPATLIVAIEGPSPDDNRRFADAVGAALGPLVGRGLRAVDVRDDVTRAYFE